MTNESPDHTDEENFDAPISRRGFLKAVGAGFALSALGSVSGVENESAKEGSPFDPEAPTAALGFVAEAMNVILDAHVAPFPTVREAEAVSDVDFNRMIGFDTEGKRQNLFVPPSIILLLQKSKMHNLVHECVHYVQYNYNGITDGTSDEVENQAVSIQNLFRSKE